ncbi:MAG TPA: lipopolysaccharide kinase InaA family protein [Planctomycetota bacterium]|nr:lipopolysaccharide kinase InaA family protein [Planctomycetota bacterium]
MGLQKPAQARGELRTQDPRTREQAAALGAELGDPGRDPERFLDAVFELQPVVWLRRMPGRETFAHGERVVVKRFRGDTCSEWWHARWHGGEPRSPARREGENLAALRALGLCVPAPIAWCEDNDAASAPWLGSRSGARSAVAMELLPHSEHLRRCLSRSSEAQVREWIAPLARVVAQLHRANWFHRDLYLQHFAVLDAQKHRLGLLDCGRARHARPVPMRWIVKDLAQLLHSAPAKVGTRARLRWLVSYARERGPDPGLERRSLARAVIVKELRMRSHRPRHLDPRTANPDGSER